MMGSVFIFMYNFFILESDVAKVRGEAARERTSARCGTEGMLYMMRRTFFSVVDFLFTFFYTK